MNNLKKYAFADLYDMASGISSTKDQAGHGAPFVSFSTVFNNYFLPDELPDLMDTSEKEQEIYSIKEGDILITRTSETIDELAMSCVATKDYPKATYSGFTKRLRPKTEGIAYSKYLAFYLRGYLFRKAVTNNAFMTLRASFNEDIFSFLNLHLPDYEQQVKIGDLFYLIEQKIQLNKKINDNLSAMIDDIYCHTFLRTKHPNTWRIGKLSEVISQINTGLNPRDNFVLGNGNIKYITVKNLTANGTIDFTNCDTVDVTAQSIIHNRSDISVGDILFASIAPLGRCYLINTEPKDWDINESIFSIRPNYQLISSEYLYSYFMSEYFVTKAQSSSTGSIFKGIRIGTLLDMDIVIPPFDIVEQFTNTTKSLFRLKQQCTDEAQQLIKLRNWLLPLLMNGQATIDD